MLCAHFHYTTCCTSGGCGGRFCRHFRRPRTLLADAEDAPRRGFTVRAGSFPARSVKPDPGRPPAPAARLRRSNEPRHSSRRPRPAMHGATTAHRARPAEGFSPQKRPKVSRFPFSRQWGGAGPRGGRRKRGVLPGRLGGKTCRVGGGGNEGNGYRITKSGRGVGARGYGFARSMASARRPPERTWRRGLGACCTA